MKSIQIIASSIAIVILAAVSFSQWRQNGELRGQIASLKAEAAEHSASAQAEAARLQQEVETRKQVIAQMDEQRKAVAGADAAEQKPAAGAEAGAKPDKQDFAGMVKKMFTDPDMKKMMRSAQTIQLKMMYSDLGKKLGLSADVANQVMELLGDRQMAMVGKSMKMLDGTKDDATAQPDSGTGEFDAQLESLLGKDGMEKLADYEKTMGDRMQLQQYKQAFAANGLPLDEKESEGLLQIMQQERLKQPPSPFDPGAKDVGAAMEAMQSDETFNRLMAEQEAVDQRVLSNARKVLSPDKMVQFETVQKQQRDMMTMGIKMGREMFKQK